MEVSVVPPVRLRTPKVTPVSDTKENRGQVLPLSSCHFTPLPGTQRRGLSWAKAQEMRAGPSCSAHGRGSASRNKVARARAETADSLGFKVNGKMKP